MSPLSVYGLKLGETGSGPAVARNFLDRASQTAGAVLAAYAVPGDVLALGRYHLVPPVVPAEPVSLQRRMTGGRAAPMGDGFVGIALTLPDRNALLAGAGARLAPEQILNRYVRGLLGALERLGVRAYYPGRDLVTVDGRVIAALGLEVRRDGATLVEMCLATGRSFAEVSGFADRADPAGVVPVDLVLPEQATSIAEVVGREPALDELTAALAAGYADRLGVDVAMGEPTPTPGADPSWLASGRLSPHLDRRASMRAMLGVVEVRASCDADRVGDVRVCGDLIAPSYTVAAMEESCRGAPVDRAELRRRVVHAAARDDGFLLGLRSAEPVADLVFEACRP